MTPKLSYDEVTEVFTLQVTDGYGTTTTMFTVPEGAVTYPVYNFDCAEIKRMVREYRQRRAYFARTG